MDIAKINNDYMNLRARLEAEGLTRLQPLYFFAGLALIIGLLARPAALGLTFLSLVAIFSVHISNGLFMANNGYEFALALLGGSIAVLIEGAGKLSADRAIAG